MNRANYRRYANHPQAVVEFKEFPERSHALILEPGWEEVAEAVAGWLDKVIGRDGRGSPGAPSG
jgi:hypothetical protein